MTAKRITAWNGEVRFVCSICAKSYEKQSMADLCEGNHNARGKTIEQAETKDGATWWVCPTCRRLHRTETDAVLCEDNHKLLSDMYPADVRQPTVDEVAERRVRRANDALISDTHEATIPRTRPDGRYATPLPSGLLRFTGPPRQLSLEAKVEAMMDAKIAPLRWEIRGIGTAMVIGFLILGWR